MTKFFYCHFIYNNPYTPTPTERVASTTTNNAGDARRNGLASQCIQVGLYQP